ncbi:magnesium transporter [Bradymonadaceae bacterium TMQ3]|uniref:Magnesium transporter MgtE n=1 Tax=Lujinxingia sediminis TaxID=2480984 RepID=A0ABY0CNQ0_9DELT|nr:magnesium transporter [Lujinxingia sediminis]RDV36175.1 magnesium transporter [Bradymonadaceae bacterium TMQ3]RVU40700.1 magnesium transporter [Lujinxingia sediminis]TXC67618.1 magnesium transporter [Bradymonadales bacterium TMQ1]
MSLEESSTPFDHDQIVADLQACIRDKRWSQVKDVVAGVPTAELADAFITLSKTEKVLAFHALPRSLAADLFSYLDLDEANNLLADLTDEHARDLAANLKPDDRTQLLEELPGQVTQRLLNLLSPQDLREARQLLGYPEESVGRLMTPDYVAVRAQWTIARAINHIRKKGRDSEIISIVYVTDAQWQLIDALELRKLILADPEATVASLMDNSFVSLSAFDDREEAVRALSRYDVVALPVVDSDGVLLGIVTVDDVLDVAEEEATEDFHKGAAVSPLDRSYRESSIWALFQKRIGWLLILVVVNLLSSAVISAYEETLATVIALAFFIPLLIGSGGNTGAQSATLMVRAIATDDVRLSQWFSCVSKEIVVGLSLGAAMGLASAVLGLFRGGWMLGVVVGLSMLGIVLVANLVGTILPFILTRARVDPAIASSPLITTIADASGLLIYFGTASFFIKMGLIG